MALASSPRLLLLLPPLQIILLLLLVLAAKSSAQERILLVYCGNTNYTSPSPYESNLDVLISNLTASTPNFTSLYSTVTVGNTPSSQIYGLAQCRPDASPATCFDCLNRSAAAAAGDVVPTFGGGDGCPHRRSASVRADHCVLRYSDQNFYSQPEESVYLPLMNTANASDPERFSQRVNALMEKIMPEAAKAESRFAVGVSNSSTLEDIYGMAWCTRDLYSDGCLLCLQQEAGALRTRQVGGEIVKVSCVVRFETVAFFDLSAVPSAPPPELGNAQAPSAAVENGTGDATRGRNHSKNLNMVWRNWDQRTTLRVVDQCLGDEYDAKEVLRCIHIGLLCVQKESSQRPSMASVMLMLSSYSFMLPAPLMPGFYIGGPFSSVFESLTSIGEIEAHVSESTKTPESENIVSITDVEPR
ncbi:Cysteine-rich repeat secretory protein 38 [Apostasia shenzhenica]|uniref:Cysteine-rich repeat secretory protein 38 n=1 Tax=Apostasia shenzhenica TaxID=1088818 RepID=A0A2I0AA17_9ASPA|nr:Cysteine-rich repeat secretory protein 38 [Apostasia shenzhenica]